MSQETIESAAESSMGAHDEAMVKVRDLKTYYDNSGLFNSTPVKAVDGVSFDIRPGETLGLVGESGCGKTTLGRTLLQLEEATDGDIRFDGTDITTLGSDELQTWRRNAQMVFQDPQSSLNDRMTIGEIIREPLDVHDWKTPRERNQRVKELLSTVGLQREHYYRYPHQFSGGQRQRISIARTLALEPDFVVLDEPVSALDVSVQAEIINLLEDLQEEFGLTYLFIAHDLSVVRHICDRVAVMYLGNIMEIGPTEELFSNPSNPYTHSLLSAIPEPDPTVDRDRITLQAHRRIRGILRLAVRSARAVRPVFGRRTIRTSTTNSGCVSTHSRARSPSASVPSARFVSACVPQLGKTPALAQSTKPTTNCSATSRFPRASNPSWTGLRHMPKTTRKARQSTCSTRSSAASVSARSRRTTPSAMTQTSTAATVIDTTMTTASRGRSSTTDTANDSAHIRFSFQCLTPACGFDAASASGLTP